MLGHVTRAQQPLVSGAIRGIFTATSAAKVARLLEDAEAELLAFYAFPAEHWPKLRSTDESFKALAALPAGPGAVRLRVGRGRPRSEEQGLGAGSPAAQLCPLEGLNVAPQWRRPRPRPCVSVGLVAAWAASCRRADGKQARPARPGLVRAGGPPCASRRPRCPFARAGMAGRRAARASAASCRSATVGRRRSPRP